MRGLGGYYMQMCALTAVVALISANGTGARPLEPTVYASASVPADALVLPANTEVPVSLNEEVSSRTARKGSVFDVSVIRDVMAGGRVVIARGTRGHGEVVYRTGRGAFGKSGKIEIKLQSVELGDRLVPLGGQFRQEGQGNTGATIGAVLAAGVIAGALVTGKSAVFEQGREFRGYTLEALALRAPPRAAVASLPTVVPAAVFAAPAVASVRPIVLAAAAPVSTYVPVAAVAAPRPRPKVGAGVGSTLVLGYSGSAEPDWRRYDRELAAQRGVHGRQPQGWSISD